jgi:hypothetical protein
MHEMCILSLQSRSLNQWTVRVEKFSNFEVFKGSNPQLLRFPSIANENAHMHTVSDIDVIDIDVNVHIIVLPE